MYYINNTYKNNSIMINTYIYLVKYIHGKQKEKPSRMILESLFVENSRYKLEFDI